MPLWYINDRTIVDNFFLFVLLCTFRQQLLLIVTFLSQFLSICLLFHISVLCHLQYNSCNSGFLTCKFEKLIEVHSSGFITEFKNTKYINLYTKFPEGLYSRLCSIQYMLITGNQGSETLLLS